ncbi:uncharacterized protein LOC119676614 [Teleopsis dalmanni]|uniref:uncharacterized protein LOC119676614 n=1 Tax=Teleopsis dalmanni TaxID=139649 RepID=UPI0018CFB709|nr:uncharacterized protein LOC119676614 [Teleopsis dalmanni]
MAMEIMALENDNANVAGVTQIVDLAGIENAFFHSFDHHTMKMWYFWIRDCLPLRIKQVYFINASKDMLRMMQIQKFFQNETDYPMTVLKTTEELYNHVPRKCLPEEYGGYNGHMAECIGYMEDTLRSYKTYFEEDILYGMNENLRSGDVIPYEAEFGLEGSFRKLELE